MSTHQSEVFVPAAECFAESSVEDTRIRNVLLCGTTSRNGYDIPPSAFGDYERVRSLYEGRPVYANHPDAEAVRGSRSSHNVLAKRSIQDLAGKIVNVRLEGGRPRGDIETRGCPQGPLVLGLASADIRGVGLSHVAFYSLRESASKPSVEIVKEVVSVDVVCGPATTNTFHESTKKGNSEMELSDMLQKQLDKAEADKAALVTESAEKATKDGQKIADLEAKLEAAETRTAELKGEKEQLESRVAELESTIALHTREKEVREALEAAGLDPADKDKVSDLFYENLLKEEDAEKRAAVIEDRANLVGARSESTDETETPAAESTRRPPKPGNKFDVKAVLDGDIFSS